MTMPAPGRMLLVETITWKPHIETGIEIALRHRDAGGEVVYCNLREGLPVCEDSRPVHALIDLPRTRIERARILIEGEGIPFVRSYYPKARCDEALRWAEDVIGRCERIEDITKIAYDDFHDMGWGILSSAISMTSDSGISPIAHRTLLVRLAAASRLIYEQSCLLIEQYHPDVVLLFNGRFATTRAVMRAAEHLGVFWRFHERGRDKDHYLTGDCLSHDPDCFHKMIDAHCSTHGLEAGHAFFRDRRAGVEQAWHSFTRGQVRGRLPDEMSAPGEWITFFSSSEDELVAIGDKLVDPAFPDQIEAIRSVAAAVREVPGLRLCIRIHPFIAQKSRADRRKWERLEIPGAVIVGPSARIDSYALIDRSKVVASFGSTVGIEATYWGRPSLLLGRSLYDRLGACHQARSQADIVGFLREPHAYPQEGALCYGSFSCSFGERYHYYRSETLHRGAILGVYLDDTPAVHLAKWFAATLRRLARRS